MKHRQTILRSCRLGLAVCFLLVGGSVIPSGSVANADVSVTQQARKITGTVKDAQGQPLLGVNVLVKGTTNGTITDLDGKYTLEAPAGATLVFSYIGFTSQEVTANGGTLNVTLKEDSQNLQEVVVVGYGTQQKKDITGSVAVVDTKELLASTGSSAVGQLQGRAAGVQVSQSGTPGSSTMIRIRGINTVNDSSPLYVIDGVSTKNQDLSSLNPNDIESMQILKDASSAAIYGAEAANGVVLITTKKGTKSGQPRLSYDGYIGAAVAGGKYDLMSSSERYDTEWNAMKNAYAIRGASTLPYLPQFGSQSDSFVNHMPNYLTIQGAKGSTSIDPSDYSYPDVVYAVPANTDWWKETNQTGIVQNHQVSLAGGNDKGTYNMSANLFDQQGTLIESYYKRYSVRSNTQFNIRPWLRFGENLTYTFSKMNNTQSTAAESSIYSWIYRSSPIIPVYDIKGNFAGSEFAGMGNMQNAVSILKRNKDNYHTQNRIFGNIWGEADLYKGLTFRTSFGLDYNNSYNYAMSKKNLEFSETSGQNSFSESNWFNYRWVWSNTLTYDAKFNEVHGLKVMVGTEAIRDGLGRSLSGTRYNYIFENNVDAYSLDMGENNGQRANSSSYNGEFALFGVFGRVDYTYADKYLLTGIVRRDGVSRFSKDNRYGVFPSISLGWRISQEGFMENTKDWLTDLKLRAGYGETGNSEIPVATNFANVYTTSPYYNNYDLSGSNTSESSGFSLSQYGNPKTKWESTNTWNVGVDATFLEGKFGTTIEAYSKKTNNMLIKAAYSSMAGEATAPYVNYGSIKNTGVDFTFNYRDKKGDWAWDLSLNLSHYKNKVIKLAAADDYALYGSGTRLEGDVTRTMKGRPIAEYYGYQLDGFYNTTADVLACQPIGNNLTESEAASWIGKFRFKDINHDGKLTTADRTALGSPHPDLTGGLNATITYKNFDFTMFWNWSIGNELFNNTKYFTDFWMFEGNLSRRMLRNSYVIGGDNSHASLPVLDRQDEYSGKYVSSYYVESASFLRLKNLVLGYTLPKTLLSKAGIQSLRLYVQAENLLTVTGYSGMDPEFQAPYQTTSESSTAELQRGVDMGAWPYSRRYMFGVNFVF